MQAETLLVTGIHREELPFGDRVAALLDDAAIKVMRIPYGIPRKRSGTDRAFYFRTEHREIYLQLLQQAKGHYRLLIDLHCGLNDAGHCADIFCHEPAFLRCLARQPKIAAPESAVRLLRIVAETGEPAVEPSNSVTTVYAHTWIPREVWDDKRCTYVGLEIYLPHDDEGSPGDWHFAQQLIQAIRACTSATR